MVNKLIEELKDLVEIPEIERILYYKVKEIKDILSKNIHLYRDIEESLLELKPPKNPGRIKMEQSGDININTTTGPVHSHQSQKVSISLLINSIYYSISTCFILTEGNYYRLLAIRKDEGKILIDKCFKTLKGARIAFAKKFKKLAWSDDVTAQWSPFYSPNREWIEEKLSGAEKAACNQP